MTDDALLAGESPLRAVRYSVTSDRYRGWTQAQRDLDALPAATATDRLRVRRTSDADVDRIVSRLEADGAARRAIEASGLSVRDYVLTTLALAQAMDVTENRGRARLVGVPSENVEIYTRYRDDVRRYRHGARYRVIDDSDSDSDSDHGRGRRARDEDSRE